jgi:hypothetical protein
MNKKVGILFFLVTLPVLMACATPQPPTVESTSPDPSASNWTGGSEMTPDEKAASDQRNREASATNAEIFRKKDEAAAMEVPPQAPTEEVNADTVRLLENAMAALRRVDDKYALLAIRTTKLEEKLAALPEQARVLKWDEYPSSSSPFATEGFMPRANYMACHDGNRATKPACYKQFFDDLSAEDRAIVVESRINILWDDRYDWSSELSRHENEYRLHN